MAKTNTIKKEDTQQPELEGAGAGSGLAVAGTASILAPADDKTVEILMTEMIVHSDKPDDIAKKRAGLVASLARHGVPADRMSIEEGWVNGERALIGTGPGKPFEMTEEMEERRRRENELAANQALVVIANRLVPPATAGVGITQADLDAAIGAATAAKDVELDALRAKIEELEKKTS